MHVAPAAALAVLASAAVPTADEPTFEERLDALVERLEAERETSHVAGLALCVVKDDEVVLARGLGLADLESGRPVDAESLFAIGSTTKAITAALIGMLVDEGEMGWDDPVTRHLPYFTLAIDGGADDEVAIRDLLSHRTGFTRMGILWGVGDASVETILKTATGAEPLAGFRERFLYNNVMYLAAGTAAGAAVETHWGELVAERVFEPLGMKSSSVSVREAQADERLVLGYRWDEDLERQVRETMIELSHIGPAGSINSNVVDMAQWLRLLLGEGEIDGRRLISEEALAETMSTHIELGPGVDYGLGWFLREWNGRTLIEHGGNIDGFSAQVAFLPEEELGFVLLANASVTPLQQKSTALVFEALLGDAEPAAEEGDESRYDPYVGAYVANFGPFEDERFTVQVSNGSLAIDVPGQTLYELEEPDEEGKWYFALTDTIAVSFDRDEGGAVVGLRMYQSGLTFELPLEGVETAIEIPLDELQPYLGTFWDEALDDEVEVLISNNRLAMDVPGQMVFEMHPPDEEGWRALRVTAEVRVRFEESEDGRVDAITIDERGEERPLTRVEGSERVALPTVEELHALRKADDRKKAFESMAALRYTGTARFAQAGVVGELEMLASGGGATRFRMALDFGVFGRVTTTFDRDRAQRSDPVRGVEELHGGRLAQTALTHPAAKDGDWRELYDEIRVTGRDEVDGRDAIVVRLAKGDLPADKVWVDAETGDLLRFDSLVLERSVRLPVTTVYSNYEEVGGVRLAHRAVTENDSSGRLVFVVDEVEILDELDEGAFAKPEADGD